MGSRRIDRPPATPGQRPFRVTYTRVEEPPLYADDLAAAVESQRALAAKFGGTVHGDNEVRYTLRDGSRATIRVEEIR